MIKFQLQPMGIKLNSITELTLTRFSPDKDTGPTTLNLNHERIYFTVFGLYIQWQLKPNYWLWSLELIKG